MKFSKSLLCLLMIMLMSVGAVFAQDAEGAHDEDHGEHAEQNEHNEHNEHDAHAEGEGDHGEHDEHAHHGTMTMSSLPSVGPDVTIRFAAQVGDRPAVCGIIYEGVGADHATMSINDYRFYVSNVRLITHDGEEVAVELEQDGIWQYANVALLDFEDGTSLCRDTGNRDLNDKVTGTVPAGDYHGLAFDLGVPFELNHLDTTTAPAPLNIPAMWWNWQSGYKFLRADLQTPDGTTPAWFAHTGSTGCVSENSNTAPEAPCNNPNVATVRLEGFDPVKNIVIADLAALLANVELNQGVAMPPGCMAGIDDPDCETLFPALGLDLATGQPIEEAPQTFFRVG